MLKKYLKRSFLAKHFSKYHLATEFFSQNTLASAID